MIPEAEFVTAYEAVRQVIDAHAGQEAWYHPTFFEFLFLMAMYVYKEKCRTIWYWKRDWEAD